jgi:tRNA(Met) C34 N-acetyltransferase TmcA
VRDLPHWLADPLRELDAGLAAALLQHGDTPADADLPAEHDAHMLHSFVRSERTYEDALAPICRLLMTVSQQPADVLTSTECNVLFAKVMQKQPWAEVAEHFALAGKAEVLVNLRRGVAHILTAVESAR